MKKLLLILLCLPMIGFGQTLIPDANFEQALINLGYDTGSPNGSVPTTNINSVTTLDVCCQNISDLTGIEDFTVLSTLHCYANQLTSLNISNNAALTFLNCGGNQITSLDVSQNTALTYLTCSANQLTSLNVSNNTLLDTLSCDFNQIINLDISNNTALIYLEIRSNQLTSLNVYNNNSLEGLDCEENQITSLDLSQNTYLSRIDCSYNQITCLDISNCTSLLDLDCTNNNLDQLYTTNGNWLNMEMDAISNNLTCVEVDNVSYATNNWGFDSFTTISTNCNYTNPCPTVSAIQEHSTNKELLRTTDLLGRETKNKPLFYIYDDGTVEKRIVIE